MVDTLDGWLKSHIHRSRALLALRSYPNSASNRSADYIPPGFFCLSVSCRPPLATRRRQIRRDSSGFGLCGFAARHVEVEHAPVRRGAARMQVVEARAGSGRFVTPLFLSPVPRPPLPRRPNRASSNEIAGRVFFDRVGSCPHRSVYFQPVRGQTGKERGAGEKGEAKLSVDSSSFNLKRRRSIGAVKIARIKIFPIARSSNERNCSRQLIALGAKRTSEWGQRARKINHSYQER